ncbi:MULTISPECIES: hypothetical protein [unclassified Nocardia]|uniref:hypothetical protein n=1 Tax=unclassified Nocardia TaxID=2637762 RepID=UPI0035D5CEBD
MALRNTIRTAMTSVIFISAIAAAAAAPATAEAPLTPVATTTPDSGSASGSATAVQTLLDAITCPFVKVHC